MRSNDHSTDYLSSGFRRLKSPKAHIWESEESHLSGFSRRYTGSWIELDLIYEEETNIDSFLGISKKGI